MKPYQPDADIHEKIRNLKLQTQWAKHWIDGEKNSREDIYMYVDGVIAIPRCKMAKYMQLHVMDLEREIITLQNEL